jgi:predicted transcriptional regulator
MSVTLSQLLLDRPPLVVARPSESVSDAMARMLEHKYSQLPVVSDQSDGRLEVQGIISTTSIARAALHLTVPPATLRVRHAVDEHPHVIRRGEDLWRTLDQVRDGQPVLVTDENDGLVGLLTGHDFTEYLRRLSEDALAVADIESTVKQLIQRHYVGRESELQDAVIGQVRGQQRSVVKDVKKLVDACIDITGGERQKLNKDLYRDALDQHLLGEVSGDFDRLTFAQYIGIFVSAAVWKTYQGPFELPVEAVRGLLDTARDLRNRLAHQRGTLEPAERDRVEYCRRLLNNVADSATAADSTPATLATTQPNEPVPEARIPEEAGTVVESLTVYLAALSVDRITLTFDEVAKYLGSGLPPEARQHRSWWTNDEERPQSALWLAAGHRVSSVNMTTGVVNFSKNTAQQEAYIKIFGAILRALEPCWFGELPSPAGRAWQAIAGLPAGGAATARVVLVFASGSRFRVELYIDSADTTKNKAAFDALRGHAGEIEEIVGKPIEWERLDHRRACRVAAYCAKPVTVDATEDEQSDLTQWVAEVAPKFYAAMQTHYRSADES